MNTQEAIEARREETITRMEAEHEERLRALPTRWDCVPIFDFLTHRHCTNCDLPITRRTPAGPAFDLGTTREHRCPEDPGEIVECQCGVLLVLFTSGKCLEWPTQDPHECSWREDQGIYSLADPDVPTTRKPAPVPPPSPTGKGVLEIG